MPKQKRSDLTLLIPELESEYETESTSTPTSSSSSTLDPNSEASYLPCNCCRPQISSSDLKANSSLTRSKVVSGNSPRSKVNSASSSVNWKLLLLLLTIASAALASILVISHQLITRHLSTSEHSGGGVTLSLTIPQTGWMSHQGLHHKLQHPSVEEEVGEAVGDQGGEADQVGEKQEDKEDQGGLTTRRYKLTTRPEGSQYKLAFHSPLSLENKLGETLVRDGMYWSSEVEATIPTGLPEQLVESELSKLRSRTVKSLEDPSWLRCGREQNRFVRFQDGSTGCARYREPNSQLIIGEVASFYLARVLGITNVPPVVLSQVDPNSPVWSSALDEVKSSSWRFGSVVALTSWKPHLVRTGMPAILRRALLARSTIDISSSSSVSSSSSADISDDSEKRIIGLEKDRLEKLEKEQSRSSLTDLSLKEAAEVAQWSDLVVFDFLTGNYDRVSSMQDTAEKESRPEILSETVHNLAKSSQTGGLWLLDNESGLFDAYTLLFPSQEMGPAAQNEALRFRAMQTDLLQTTCIFRRQTVDRVFNLYKAGDAAGLLDAFVSRAEPLYRELLEALPRTQQDAWRDHFQGRVEEVWTWMKQCQEDVRFW